jgi:hypothetical protein
MFVGAALLGIHMALTHSITVSVLLLWVVGLHRYAVAAELPQTSGRHALYCFKQQQPQLRPVLFMFTPLLLWAFHCRPACGSLNVECWSIRCP